MSLAIGISTLLLGGWVLNTPVQDLTPEELAQTPGPAFELPFRQLADTSPGTNVPPPWRNPDAEKGQQRDEVKQRQRELNEPATQAKYGEGARKEAAAKGQAAPQRPSTMQKQTPWILPPQPTDPLTANVPGGPQYPLPPTVRESDLRPGTGAVDPYSSTTTPRMIEVPPSRQAMSPRTVDTPAYGDPNAAPHSSYFQQPPPPKPFADARPYSSGVSPYMNLFRNDTNGDTIDNYSTFVRPALQQQGLNQQFNMDIYGLERQQRLQSAALQQLGRGYSRAPQVIGTPQFYLNYGNYYPANPNGQGGGYGAGGYGAGGYGP